MSLKITMNNLIISEEPLNLYEAKKELKILKKRDEDLSLRAGRCEEYINQFTPLTEKAAKELKVALEALDIPRLRPEHIAKLIDILPLNEEDIKVILLGMTIKGENITKIASTLAEYRK